MTDLDLIRYLGTTTLHGGWLEQEVRERFGLSMAQSWQRVLRAIDDLAVEQAEPVIVHRLRRIRDQRRAARVA